jgi:hypothetical protein
MPIGIIVSLDQGKPFRQAHVEFVLRFKALSLLLGWCTRCIAPERALLWPSHAMEVQCTFMLKTQATSVSVP